jgi:hypothetical protein
MTCDFILENMFYEKQEKSDFFGNRIRSRYRNDSRGGESDTLKF